MRWGRLEMSTCKFSFFCVSLIWSQVTSSNQGRGKYLNNSALVCCTDLSYLHLCALLEKKIWKLLSKKPVSYHLSKAWGHKESKRPLHCEPGVRRCVSSRSQSWKLPVRERSFVNYPKNHYWRRGKKVCTELRLISATNDQDIIRRQRSTECGTKLKRGYPLNWIFLWGK